MNYIKEINAFHEEQLTNPVSGKAMKLWFTLMHINNKTCWKDTFTVAASVLCLHGKLSNSSFKRARTELRDKGYIRYESRAGNQAAKYEIISLEHTYNHDKNADQKSSINEQVLDHSEQTAAKDTNNTPYEVHTQSNPLDKLDHNVSPLLKQKETKKGSLTAANAIAFFKENFGKISPYIRTELNQWVNDISESLVIAAMKRALDRGKASWGYVKGILQTWKDKAFQTVEETESEIVSFQKPDNQPKKKQRSEVIPDWFFERNSKEETSEADRIEEMNYRIEFKKMLADLS